MTAKWAVLGMPYGGGKAVLAVPNRLEGGAREGLLRRYLHKTSNSLCGIKGYASLIARRFEIWVPTGSGGLVFKAGHCDQGIDIEMNPILGLLPFGDPLEEDPRLLPVRVHQSPGIVPVFLRNPHLVSPVIPRVESGGRRLHDVADGGRPELSQRLRVGGIKGDLE